MFGWLSASMSGFTRSATAAWRDCARGELGDAVQLTGDSALIAPTSAAIAYSSSSRVFPTPVKTMSRGANPARAGHLNLAGRIGVRPAADGLQQPRDGERRVRFERVMNGVRIRGERAIDRAVRVADGAGAVDVGRRAHLRDQRGHADAVAEKALFGRLERWMHERFACYHARIPAISAPHSLTRHVR